MYCITCLERREVGKKGEVQEQSLKPNHEGTGKEDQNLLMGTLHIIILCFVFTPPTTLLVQTTSIFLHLPCSLQFAMTAPLQQTSKTYIT